MNARNTYFSLKNDMKILLVANGVVRAGVSRVISLLSKAWAKEHDLHLAIFKAYDGKGFPIEAKIVLQDIPLRGLISSQVWHLYWLFKNHTFDRIYGFSEDANYPLIVAARLAGVTDKVILSVHILPERFSNKTKRRVLAYYPFAKSIIAVSQGVKERLIDMGLPKHLVTFIPNPIDVQDLEKQANDTQNLPAPLTQVKIPYMVAMGRLHPHKGFDLLVRAFAQAIKQIPNNIHHLYIIGAGQEITSLQALIEQEKIQDSVKLIGELTNPFPLLSKADLFIMSSRQESWGLVLVEAMALKVPVLATNCPYGAKEILDNGRYGKLIPCESIEEMSKEIVDILNTPNHCKEMTQNAYLQAKQFDLPIISQKWLTI